MAEILGTRRMIEAVVPRDAITELPASARLAGQTGSDLGLDGTRTLPDNLYDTFNCIHRH